MYPVSDEFLAAVREDHTDYCEAEFFYRGVSKGIVPIIGGDVSVDKSATIRRTCNLSFSGASPELALPGVADYFDSPLWPIGNEVQVRAGIQFDDGTRELVPMGLFRVSKPHMTHVGDELAIGISGFDRGRRISRAKWTTPYSVAKGTDYATAIKLAMQNRLPVLQDDMFVQWMKTDGTDGTPIYTTPALTFTMDNDPWVEIQNMAKSFGAEVLFDGEGLPVLRPESDPVFTPSVFDYVAGEDCTWTHVTRELNDEETYNGVIAIGTSPDKMMDLTHQQPRAEAWDINPNSPTYYDPLYPDASEFGAVPFPYTSNLMTSNAQCQAAADAMLIRVAGILESVSFDGLNNYAHDAGDVIRGQDLDIGIDSNYLFDAVKFGLGYQGQMSGITRKRRTG